MHRRSFLTGSLGAVAFGSTIDSALAQAGGTASIATGEQGDARLKDIAMASPKIRMVKGSNFVYALPDGWIKTEESNTVLVLIDPSNTAMILVIGVSGLINPTTPDAYAQTQIVQAYSYTDGPVANFRFLSGRPIPAMRPYQQAGAFEVEVTRRFGNETRPVRGVILSNVSNVYRRTDCMLTLAVSRADRWDSYKSWLPETAAFAVNVGPNPFNLGMISQVITGNVRAEAGAFRQYRAYSQELRDAVQAGRDKSQAGRANDTSLTGQKWYDNPYGGEGKRLNDDQRHWINDRGEIISLDNPNLDPNTSTDQRWRPMPAHN